MEITEYPPFKSRDAKEKYLKSYNRATMSCLILSESRMLNTSYSQKFVQIKRRINNE